MAISVGSDNLVSLLNLYDSLGAVFLDSATVTGNLLLGSTTVYTFGLSYITASTGCYLGVIPHSVVLVVDNVYTVQVVATAGGTQLTLNQTELAEIAAG